MKHTKKQLIKTLTLATTVVLAGCNGGGGASSSTPSTPDTPSNPTTVYNLSPLKITVQSETESGVVLNDGKLDLSAVTGFHYVKVTLTNTTAYPIDTSIGNTFYKVSDPKITFTGIDKVKNILPTDCSNYTTVKNRQNDTVTINNLPPGQSCTKEYYINEPTSLFIDGNESGESKWTVGSGYTIGETASNSEGVVSCSDLGWDSSVTRYGYIGTFFCDKSYNSDPNVQLNVTQSTSDLFSVIFPLTDKTLSMSNPSPNGAYILDMESSNGVYTGYRYTPTGFTDRLTYSNKSAGFNVPANFAIQSDANAGLQVGLDGKYAVIAGAVWDMSNPQSPQSMPAAGTTFPFNQGLTIVQPTLGNDNMPYPMLDGSWYATLDPNFPDPELFRFDLSNGSGDWLNEFANNPLYGFGLSQAFPNGYKVIGGSNSTTPAGIYCQAPDGTKTKFSGGDELNDLFGPSEFGPYYSDLQYRTNASYATANAPVDYDVADWVSHNWWLYMSFDEKTCSYPSSQASYIFATDSEAEGLFFGGYGMIRGKSGTVYLPSSAFPKQN